MTYDFHRRRGSIARGQWFSVAQTHFYERPSGDPEIPEIWCYTSAPSYRPGDEVAFHISTSVTDFSLKVLRDGVSPETVHETARVEGRLHHTPPRAYRDGCGWPVAHRWTLPDDARSGGYIVSVSIDDGEGGRIEQQAFFVVRASAKKSPIILIAATATWNAYNDWGGANHYEGVEGEGGNEFSPVLSNQRPWARGLIWLPEGAPRVPTRMSRPGGAPRYPAFEFALAQGFGKYYAAAGWASYERHFVQWAERNDFDVDVITQCDLDREPGILDEYPCAVIVGHDEYWSRRMRTAVDRWVDRGGRLARFAGNYFWQIRLEDDGDRQVCYKYEAHARDPVMGTPDEPLATTLWEDPVVNYPGAATMGLNGSRGVYVGVGGFMPRGQRGFTVYRPDHWAFDGADTYFGDILGSDAGVYGFEVDGVDFNFRNGLPYPTFSDGAPDTLQILAMGPASLVEEDHANPGTRLYVGDSDGAFIASMRFPEDASADAETVRYGAGMMAVFQRGQGEVFNAASCEWIMGLVHGDHAAETVTRNVLRRFSGVHA